MRLPLCLLYVEAPLAAWSNWDPLLAVSQHAAVLGCLPPSPPPLPPAKEFRVRVAPDSGVKSIMRILI